MIPPPALMIRSAFAFLHFGHFFVGSALIDWNSSHVLSQALHRYSYVGIKSHLETRHQTLGKISSGLFT